MGQRCGILLLTLMTTRLENLHPRGDIVKTILRVIQTAGLITVALVAPNAIQLFGRAERKRKRPISRWEINRALGGLKRRGYIQYQHTRQGEQIVRLTATGIQQVAKLHLADIQIPVPKHWDGKWRLVLFDIPHAERNARTAVRRKLQELGFYQVQKSVYVHPFECYSSIKSVQDFYHVQPYLYYAVVDRLEGDKRYRYHFNLSSI